MLKKKCSPERFLVACLWYSKLAPASITVERKKSPELGVLEAHSLFPVSAMMKCLQVKIRRE
jgi:hypothetical protein